MHNLELYTLAVDLKVPDAEPVKIMEIMQGHHAGTKGYTQITGEDITLAHILPF